MFNLQLCPVPKKLGQVKQTWNPKTTLISFKLETDEGLLEKKAKGAIEKYGVDMVVANILEKRRFEVIVYHKSGESKKLTREKSDQVDEISSDIVNYIRDKLGIIEQEEKQAQEEAEELKKEEEMHEQEGYTKHKLYDRKLELFISNLGIETDEESLKNHFEAYGKLVKAKLLKRNNRPTGRAFVEYYDEEHAKNALEEMNDKVLGAKRLRVQFACEFEEQQHIYRTQMATQRGRGRNKKFQGGSRGGYGGYTQGRGGQQY